MWLWRAGHDWGSITYYFLLASLFHNSYSEHLILFIRAFWETRPCLVNSSFMILSYNVLNTMSPLSLWILFSLCSTHKSPSYCLYFPLATVHLPPSSSSWPLLRFSQVPSCHFHLCAIFPSLFYINSDQASPVLKIFCDSLVGLK